MSTPYDEDPIGHLLERVQAAEAALTQTQSAMVGGLTAQDEAEARAVDGLYDDKARFVREARAGELVAAGLSPEQALAQVQAESWRLAAAAKAQGRKIPDVVEELATARGYQPPKDDNQRMGDLLRSLQAEQRGAPATAADKAFDKLFGGG